jgi:hypothetical protein
MPVPYYTAALLSWFGVDDPAAHRTFFASMVVCTFAIALWLFRCRLSSIFMCTIIVSFAIGHPMFSGHMFLADQLFALSLLLLLLLVLTFDGRASIGEQIAISIATFSPCSPL